jgi:hypothetical protein
LNHVRDPEYTGTTARREPTNQREILYPGDFSDSKAISSWKFGKKEWRLPVAVPGRHHRPHRKDRAPQAGINHARQNKQAGSPSQARRASCATWDRERTEGGDGVYRLLALLAERCRGEDGQQYPKVYTSLFTHHIEPVFGQTALHDIKRFNIEAFLSQKLKEGYSSQTVHHLRNVVSSELLTARRWEWLEENPARMIELGRVHKVRPARTLSLEEAVTIAKSLPEAPRAGFATGVFFGLRIGEVLGLKITDVDFERRILKAERSATRGSSRKRRGRKRSVNFGFLGSP